MIPIPGYSPKLAEIVGLRLHWTITHYRGLLERHGTSHKLATVTDDSVICYRIRAVVTD